MSDPLREAVRALIATVKAGGDWTVHDNYCDYSPCDCGYKDIRRAVKVVEKAMKEKK